MKLCVHEAHRIDQRSSCRAPVCFGVWAKTATRHCKWSSGSSTFVLPIIEAPVKAALSRSDPVPLIRTIPFFFFCGWLSRRAEHVTRRDICGFWLQPSASKRWEVFLSLLLMRRINSSTHCVPTNIATCEVNADNAPLSCLCFERHVGQGDESARVGVRHYWSSQGWLEPWNKNKIQVRICSCVQCRSWREASDRQASCCLR